MRDRIFIFSGLLLFLMLATYPMWHGVVARTSSAAPKLELPKQAKDCVAPREYMRASHMKLLISWREGDVRENQLRYKAYDGKTYEVNLTKTCLGECHGSKENFCDKCHTYAAVSGPYCWDCHTDIPKKAVMPGTDLVAHSTRGAP